MINMLAVVPDPWITESKVTGTSSDDGVLSDISLEVHLSDDQKFTVRTLVRRARGSVAPARYTAR